MNLRKIVLISLILSQIAGCGSIFYPDRRGQIDGQIDPVIAGLDAVGLLFYIVPGVVALGVDFTTGAIYFPKNRYTLSPQQLHNAWDESGQLDRRKLQQLIEQETGRSISLTTPEMRMEPLTSQQLNRLHDIQYSSI